MYLSLSLSFFLSLSLISLLSLSFLHSLSLFSLFSVSLSLFFSISLLYFLLSLSATRLPVLCIQHERTVAYAKQSHKALLKQNPLCRHIFPYSQSPESALPSVKRKCQASKSPKPPSLCSHCQVNLAIAPHTSQAI